MWGVKIGSPWSTITTVDHDGRERQEYEQRRRRALKDFEKRVHTLLRIQCCTQG
jgi:hypothetical protein